EQGEEEPASRALEHVVGGAGHADDGRRRGGDGQEGEDPEAEAPVAQGARVQLALRLERDPRGPVGDDEGEPRDADEQRVRVEQLEEGAGVVAGGVERYAADDVAEGDAHEERWHEAAEEEGAVPDARPARVAVAELE